jgi:hypothetical protein
MNKLLLVLLAGLVLGCAKNTTEPNDGTNIPLDSTKGNLHTIPQAGSKFFYTYKESGSPDSTFEFEVLDTGLVIRGKKKVSRFTTGQASIFVAYEPTGDFSMLGLLSDSAWLPMPIQSKVQAIVPPVRTDYSSEHHSTIEWMCTPFRPQDVSVNGKLLKGYEIELIEINKDYDLNNQLVDTDRDTVFLTWSHEIGFFTRFREREGEILELSQYNIK